MSGCPVLHKPRLCAGGAPGDEGPFGGAGERQYRRGGQTRPHDLGAAPSAGFAAGVVFENHYSLCGFWGGCIFVSFGWEPFGKKALSDEVLENELLLLGFSKSLI